MSLLSYMLLAPLVLLPVQFACVARAQRYGYAAFGDSFAAGIGAGAFYSEDQQDNVCARMTKSYPVQLENLLRNSPRPVTDFFFRACFGDVLDDIDGQVQQLKGQRVSIASVSISGNDFNFGNVVELCVREETGLLDCREPQAACDQQLNTAEAAIGNDGILAKYRDKLRLIMAETLPPGGLMYVTGYARFFSPDGSAGDQRDTTPFFNHRVVRKLVGVLNMRTHNRDRMNDLVQRVNARILNDVVNARGGQEANIFFIDIDPHFEGHRFCEPHRNPWGSNDDRVQFNDLYTDLGEEGTWNGPAHPDDLWGPGRLPNDPSSHDPDFRGISDKLQQNSVFHPKAHAHLITAALMFADILKRWVLALTYDVDA